MCPDPHNNNKGEKDASEGKYDPPHSVDTISDIISAPFHSKEELKDMEEYSKGWNNTHDQIESNKSGCFFTTACVEAAGLPDNCHELTVLRQFRDNYVAQLPKGKSMISEYYASAPCIVERIQRSPQKNVIFNTILSDVRRAVFLIEADKKESAFILYRKLFTRLNAKF